RRRSRTPDRRTAAQRRRGESPVGIDLACGGEHRRRRVDHNHLMADYLEVAREPSLTATEIEGPLARCGHQLEELVAVKLPVAVVAGLARPRDELGRVLLPG